MYTGQLEGYSYYTHMHTVQQHIHVVLYRDYYACYAMLLCSKFILTQYYTHLTVLLEYFYFTNLLIVLLEYI